MKPTEATALAMGGEARAAGRPLLGNPFSMGAYHTVQRKLGRWTAPKMDEWNRWQSLWNKGWLEADKELRHGCDS